MIEATVDITTADGPMETFLCRPERRGPYPAVFFLIFSIVQVVRFHLNISNLQVTEVASISFLLIWLLSLVGTFSLLNIVVGTHYLLPLTPPVVLAGAFGLITLLR